MGAAAYGVGALAGALLAGGVLVLAGCLLRRAVQREIAADDARAERQQRRRREATDAAGQRTPPTMLQLPPSSGASVLADEADEGGGSSNGNGRLSPRRSHSRGPKTPIEQSRTAPLADLDALSDGDVDGSEQQQQRQPRGGDGYDGSARRSDAAGHFAAAAHVARLASFRNRDPRKQAWRY